jgi:hypothetical protein
MAYIPSMEWEIEVTDEFTAWWKDLTDDERESVRASVTLLEELGPNLPFPHSSGIKSSKHGRMRELRVQHEGRPYRVLYAFDPRRVGILLIGGDKSGDKQFYEQFVPIADKLYDDHLTQLRNEGAIDD